MNSLEGKHIVVTGGCGFAGSHLIDRLIDEKPRMITALSNFSIGKRSNLFDAMARYPVKIERLELSDRVVVAEFFGDSYVDVVFHLAAIPLLRSIKQPEETVRNMVDAALNICEAQRRGYFKTLIQFSSSEVYGTRLTTMNEFHPTFPTTPYAAAKLAADQIVLSYVRTFGIDAALVRPFNFYGPRQHSGTYGAIIPITICRILRGEEIYIDGDGEQTRDFTYVSDVIDATISIYKNPTVRGMAINVGSGKETSIKDLVKLLATMMGGAKIVHRLDRVSQVRNHEANIDEARTLLNYSPTVSLGEGLGRTIKYYERQTEMVKGVDCGCSSYREDRA